METKGSLPAVGTSRVSKLSNRCFAAAVVLLAELFFGALCQAQILGTSQLNTARRGHTATLLQDGKILIVGGDNQTGIIGQAEIYDPATRNFTAGPSLQTARTDHAAIALPDGRVLVIGGRDQNGSLTSSEIYNPLTGSFTSGPSMTTPRSGHTVTALSNGNILVAGGDAVGSAEIYNPAAQSFSPIAANMIKARKFHSAILTSAGQVLIVGGVNTQNAVLNTAEIYDPASQSFYLPPADMKSPRAFASLKLLSDGKVQIIGGDSDFSMEIFDPQDGKFNAVAYLPPTPDLLGATLSTRSRAALVSLYASLNPNLLSTTLTPEQLALLDRADHTITELSSQNQALVAGGISGAGQVLNSASLVSSSPASVTTDKTDYAPGTIVTITGKGFQPNEDVAMALHERPDAYPDFAFTAPADNQGNFTFMQFAPQSIDIGRTFTLTAVGQSSGFTAQTAFTDATNVNSVSVGAQVGSVTYGTAGSVTYPITVNGTGNGTLTIQVSGLPSGVTFAPTTFPANGNCNASQSQCNFTLTVTTTNSTPAGASSFTLTVNGVNSSNTGSLNVSKRNAAWSTSPNSKSYGDTDPTPLTTGTGSNFLAADGVTATYTRAAGETVAGGPYHITATLSPAGVLGNYNITNNGADFTVNKKNASVTPNAASKTYGDPDPALTGTLTGFLPADGVTASYSRTAGETVAGSPYTISATLSPPAALGNYSITYNTANFTINKKDATWTTNPNSKTYGDSEPVPLTTGNGSGFLTSDGVTATYNRAAGENASPPTYHITATLSATVSGALNNYNITNAGAEFTINKRNATWTTNAASKTYGDNDLNPLTTGSGSGFLPSDNLTATYSRAAGETVAGSPYHITATLSPAGVLGNYNITNTGADFTIIAKVASVTPDASSKTYGDADPTFTGTLVGFLAADGVTATYTRTTGESVAGSPYVISVILSPASVLSNYDITYKTANFTINKANAICTVNGYTGTYDGAAHGGTGSCKGVDGTTVLAGLDLGASFTNVPGGTANWSFTDVTGNYNDQSGSVAIVINKADATIMVSGYTGVYDGIAHGASGTATGVGGVDLSGSLNFGATFTSVPGGTAHWTFAGGTNYNDASGDVAIVINKANASINVVGYTGIFDGTPHGASGSATGVGNVNLSALLNLGLTFTNVPGGTAHWTFSGGTNYNDASGDVAIVINKADAIITVNGYTGFYNGNTHGATGTATGLAGADLTAFLNLGVTFVDAPGGTAHWMFNGGTNYNDAAGDVAIVINQATPTIDVTGGTFTDNAQPHGATGFAYGIGGVGDVLSPPVTFSYEGSGYGPTANAPSAPGTYLATATFAGNTNYTSAYATANITIENAAPQTQGQAIATNEDVPLPITLRARDLDSNGLAFTITSKPANGSLDVTTGALTCTSVPIAPGAMSCTAAVTYTPNQNYNGSDSFTFKVNDGELDSNEATVTLTVYPMNDAPIANAQSVSTDDFTRLAITLTGSDVETGAANLTFVIVDQPANGTMSGTPPNVTYTPNLNYKGPDSFTFTVTDRGDPDNCGGSSPACADAKTSPKTTVSITVTDGTAPQTLITDLKPASLSNDRNPSFGFSGTDNVTDPSLISFECNLDYNLWMACGTSGSPTTSYSNLADGSHTFQVRAKDDSGNVDQNPPSYTWIIDATPPDTAIDSQPAALVNSSTATFTYHSNENGTFLCSLDDGAAVDCSSSATQTYTNLTDGQHTFSVAAKDQAGNLDSTPAMYVWNIDTTAPHTTISSGPANPTTSTTATFVFDSANSPGDQFQCRLDGSPANFAPCTSPATYTGLSLGNHMFEVRGKDSANNMETTPATYSWMIGQVTLDQYTIDSDFKRFDGFDVVFGKGSQSNLKINSANPDSFHYQIKLTNNTGLPMSAANGNVATAIITIPGMPSSCGGVACSSQVGSLADPAFILKGRKVAHVWPGYHDRDGDNDDDDMPVTLKYMTLAQYQANGNSCADNSSYSSTFPSNGAPKCIKITGFSIPVKHSARIRLNFQFRWKGTDGWNANSQQLFYAGFVFKATTSVNFGSSVQTASDATGIIGAGKKATAIGGYVFSGITPGTGNIVRLFTKKTEASCTVNSKLVAQGIVDANGFYYIWRSGADQQNSNANSLPSGVQYSVQLCDGSTQLGLTSIDSKLREQEFEQIDFNP